MMAAQVEVQTGEVGRTLAPGRHHLSPLTDSSNKSLIEISPISQSHIITPEPNKPVPGPKPRLTPKPFVVDKNPTIKPILAPKPQTKPRPESTQLAGYKPELPCIAKPQQPVATRPVSTNPNRPAPTTFKTSNKLNTGQTTKPAVQSFKPALPLDLRDPSKLTPPVPAERRKTGPKSLAYSKSLKKPPVAEWSEITKKEDEKDQATSCKGGAPITRAKSMGCLDQLEHQEKEKTKAVASVPLRPQPRSARPRPVSAIFLDSPTKTETPVPAPRWGGRRPLSADLTSKFESIGLSLHRKTPKTNTKENTPEEKALPQVREHEPEALESITLQSPDDVAKPAISDHDNKKTEEVVLKDTDEKECRASIRSRISLLLDSSLSPGTAATCQGSDLNSPVQVVPDSEPPVGVKQLIKQLTEDTTPTQSPVMKPALKPRPLPLDLTKMFSSEKSPDLGSEATDHSEISNDPQRRSEESAVTPRDQTTFVDLTDSQQHVKKAITPEVPDRTGHTFGPASEESGPGVEVQTVRASLFENIVERHSVQMVDETKPVEKFNKTLTLSSKTGCNDDQGTVVTATYKEPLGPSSPLRVVHAFDTVQAVEENRAVSENIPSAQWEDKAMTLRSRRSEGSRIVAENTGSTQQELALPLTTEQHPRYLRVGALQKWTTTDFDQHQAIEKGTLTESQREVFIDKNRDKQKEAEQEEVSAPSKPLKRLHAEEQPKPKATYFALTAQLQQTVSPFDAGANEGGMTLPFDDLSVRTVVGGSQGKILPVRRNPSIEDTFGKILHSQDQVEDSVMRSHLSNKDIRTLSDGQTEEMTEVEKNRELRRETERHIAKMRELEREKQRQLDLEKQAHLEFARMKEREMQREFERQRQKAFQVEKQEMEEKQRALERQKQIELEKHKLQQLEREKQRELERERQWQLEREKQLELERQREIERERVREQERERLRQREEEQQRELDKERHLLEIQKEKMEEQERMKELERNLFREFQKQKQIEKERQQILDLERQRQRKMEREEAEKIKQMAIDQEIIRLKELERERERQREMEKERQKEIEWEKQRELERQRQNDLERERQRQLDLERQELENQRLRQEQERERQRKDELERIKEMERRQLLEFEKQKAERERQQIWELEKKRLREKMEREEAEKIRKIAKQQEAERQRLKEKQKKEEQERARLEALPLRPKVVDLDSVLRNDPSPKYTPQRSDPAMRWKEPSPRAEESYKPIIHDIDTFTSQTQLSPSKDLFPVSSIQVVDTSLGTRLQPTPERDVSWKVPPQTPGSVSSPVWTTSPQDPWELWPNEMSVDKPAAEPKKHANRFGPEQLLMRQEERHLASQRHGPVVLDDPFQFGHFPQTKTVGSPGGGSSSTLPEPVWIPREPQLKDSRGPVQSHRRSQGSHELNRMRSRSVSRRSAPSNSAVDGSLSRMRSRSAHRERDRHSWVQQKQSVRDEEEGKDSETPVGETDSQYGTWETGLRTDDSLTPATPSSESNLSPSPRKPTPPHTPGEHGSQFETDTLDGFPPSSSESQLPSLPDVPTTLLDTSALRSRAQLGKKRAPRTRPTRAARQSAVLAEGEGGTTEDWLYRDSTEAKVESKDDDSDSEDKNRVADSNPAVASQPQRIALFPGVDPSALKAQLKKRGDSDNQTDGTTPSPSQLSRSPKSPFLPRGARVLPTAGGKENGEEDSPQWLKELKSKKRLSQYENEC